MTAASRQPVQGDHGAAVTTAGTQVHAEHGRALLAFSNKAGVSTQQLALEVLRYTIRHRNLLSMPTARLFFGGTGFAGGRPNQDLADGREYAQSPEWTLAFATTVISSVSAPATAGPVALSG